MAFRSVAIAVATAGIALFVFFQLVAAFGVPELEVLAWKTWTETSSETVQESLGRITSQESVVERQSAGDEYLIGVGKADITGYILFLLERILRKAKL